MAESNQERIAAGRQRVKDSIGTVSGRVGVGWIMLIYFVSGACSLIDEVIWVRLLKLTLGNTVYASSIVISTFMGGLALGAFIMGRYSDRISRRLRLYGLLETLVTISAVSLPFALRVADNLYVWFYRSYGPTKTQLLIVQVLISAAILLVPSLLMGSTLPLLGRFVTSFEKEAGHLVGKLYALNTLGAAAGCFLAGFVLIRAFGVMGTLYIAAALNLLVALSGWCLSRLSIVTSGEVAENAAAQNREAVTAKEPDTLQSDRFAANAYKFYILIAAFFMSGLISIGYELLWMRSIIHLLSGFTYVFSAVLTIYLLGNVIGAAIGSGLIRSLKVPFLGLAVTLFLLGLCGIFYLPVLILWSSDVMPWVNAEVENASNFIPFSVFVIKPLVQSAFLFLVPAIIMGIGFPIALQAWTNHVHKVGRSTGTAYAANTIGAVIGGLITGFVLIPLMGLQLSITILGLAGVWIAGIICLMFVRSSRRFWRFGFLAAAGVLTVVAAAGPSNLFDTVVASNPMLPKQLELLEVKEGVTTTVSLYRYLEEDTLYLYVSGQRIAGDTYFWRSDQKMLGHFGVLLNSNAKKVLSVGFGSGESMACLALHDLERADCAEIAPEVVDVSLRFFKHINLGDHLDDYVNMVYMDAKNYIHLTDIKYDAIVNDSIHPRHFAENASLYTKEYYESAREHLNENGLFLSWIPTHNTEPAAVLNSIMGTMLDVFPYVTIWYMTPSPAWYFLVVGSVQPQYFLPKYMEDELGKEGVRESLSLININNSQDVMSCYIGDKEDLKRHIKSYTVNSDYSPFIEFVTDERAGGNWMFMEFIRDVRSDSVYRHIDWTGYSEKQKQKWLSEFKRLYKVSTYLLLTNSTDDYLKRMEYCMEGLSILPDNPALLDVRQRSERMLLSSCEKLIVDGQPKTALVFAERMLRMHTQSALGWVIRSIALQEMGDVRGAFNAAKMAVSNAPDNPDAHMRLGSTLSAYTQFEQAIVEYQEALRLGKNDSGFASKREIQLLNALTIAYMSAGRAAEAIDTAEKALALAKSTGRRKIAEDMRKLLNSLKTGNK